MNWKVTSKYLKSCSNTQNNHWEKILHIFQWNLLMILSLKKKKKSTPCVTIPIDEIAFYIFSGLVLLLKINKKCTSSKKRKDQSVCTLALCFVILGTSAPNSRCLTLSCSLGVSCQKGWLHCVRAVGSALILETI